MCASNCGPCFGGDGDFPDLVANEPFNGKNKCTSWVNRSAYRITYKNRKNYLTNQSLGDFEISELEVWLLVDDK